MNQYFQRFMKVEKKIKQTKNINNGIKFHIVSENKLSYFVYFYLIYNNLWIELEISRWEEESSLWFMRVRGVPNTIW